MSDCNSCVAEKLCVYEYKPCDCVHMRKFKPHPKMIACDVCNNTGHNPYPLKCSNCNGTGAIIKD